MFIAVMFLIKWSEPKGKVRCETVTHKNAINGLYEEMFVDVMWSILRGKQCQSSNYADVLNVESVFVLSLSYDGMDSEATKLAC